MSPAKVNSSHVHSNSATAIRGDQATRSLQSSFHDGDPAYKPKSPPLTRINSDQSSVFDSRSHASGVESIHESSLLPKATSTKRDKFVGNVNKAIGKAMRDPELRERGMLRAAGGKDLANGLAVVESKDL